MVEPEYGKLAKKAADAVRGLKEPALSIAYAKILDDLIAREGGASKPEPRPGAKGVSAGAALAGSVDGDPVDTFLNRPVDASTYADLFRANGKLVMKCLAVLKLARDEFGLDGLGPSTLESILKKKFRAAGVHQANISRDLGNSLKFVSRVNRDGRPVYILTAQGEEALKLAVSDQSAP